MVAPFIEGRCPHHSQKAPGRPRESGGASFAEMRGYELSRRAVVQPQRADAIKFDLLARVLLGLLARLVALVEQFDLLQFFERLAERSLGVVELPFQLTGRAAQIFAPP